MIDHEKIKLAMEDIDNYLILPDLLRSIERPDSHLSTMIFEYIEGNPDDNISEIAVQLSRLVRYIPSYIEAVRERFVHCPTMLYYDLLKSWPLVNSMNFNGKSYSKYIAAISAHDNASDLVKETILSDLKIREARKKKSQFSGLSRKDKITFFNNFANKKLKEDSARNSIEFTNFDSLSEFHARSFELIYTEEKEFTTADKANMAVQILENIDLIRDTCLNYMNGNYPQPYLSYILIAPDGSLEVYFDFSGDSSVRLVYSEGAVTECGIY